MFTSQSGKTVLCLCLLFVLVLSNKECDKSKCKGPIRFYEELKCKPVYENPGDCCAVRYDCSHLSTRNPHIHCYSNGREYNFGETLRREDHDDPCESRCKCKSSGIFESCAVYDIILPQLPREDCFHRFIRGTCYNAEVICPKEGEERAKCEVEGKTYLDGQDFYPMSRQDLNCACRPGFKGEFVEPFCWRSSCNVENKNYPKIHQNCAPFYYQDRSPQLSCPYRYRCQSSFDNDEIIPASDKTSVQSNAEKVSDNMKCKFGNLLLNIGDKVKKTVIDNYYCVTCECEVPPTPTCREIPESECGFTRPY